MYATSLVHAVDTSCTPYRRRYRPPTEHRARRTMTLCIKYANMTFAMNLDIYGILHLMPKFHIEPLHS